MEFIIMVAPIVVSVIVLIYALAKGFNKRALFVSAVIAMAIAMFIMKRNATWYGFLTAMTVPFAVCYVAICLYLSIQENREMKGNNGNSDEE